MLLLADTTFQFIKVPELMAKEHAPQLPRVHSFATAHAGPPHQSTAAVALYALATARLAMVSCLTTIIR